MEQESSLIKSVISYFADPSSEMLYQINNASIALFKEKFENKSKLDPQDPWFAIVNDPLKCMKFLKELIKNQKDIESNVKQNLKNKKELQNLVKAEIDLLPNAQNSEKNEQNPSSEKEFVKKIEEKPSEKELFKKIEAELTNLENSLKSETDPIKKQKIQKIINAFNENKKNNP